MHPHALRHALQTFTYDGAYEDEYFVLIRCPVSKLRQIAQKLKHRMLLDATKLRTAGMRGEDEIYAPFEIASTPSDVTTIKHDPYDYHFIPWSETAEELFVHEHRYTHPTGKIQTRSILDPPSTATPAPTNLPTCRPTDLPTYLCSRGRAQPPVQLNPPHQDHRSTAQASH